MAQYGKFHRQKNYLKNQNIKPHIYRSRHSPLTTSTHNFAGLWVAKLLCLGAAVVDKEIEMGHTMYIYVPIALTVVYSLLRPTGTVVTIYSPGGHVGDEFNIHCNIRNHNGAAEFFRLKDGIRERTDNATKYKIYRCDKTDGDVSGEDSVLTVFEASVSDSGTYVCVPRNGQLDWQAAEQTNITVRPACSSGSDDTKPSSLTTDANQGNDSEKRSKADRDVMECSAVYAVLFVVTVIALLVVSSVLLYRECRHRDHRRPNNPDTARDGENDTRLNTTQENLMPPSGNPPTENGAQS